MSKTRRKCHAARRRANRLRRVAAAQAALERNVDVMRSMLTGPAAGTGDALPAKLLTMGCLAAAAAVLAALAWFAWFAWK